jgi:hypothetical protein
VDECEDENECVSEGGRGMALGVRPARGGGGSDVTDEGLWQSGKNELFTSR